MVGVGCGKKSKSGKFWKITEYLCHKFVTNFVILPSYNKKPRHKLIKQMKIKNIRESVHLRVRQNRAGGGSIYLDYNDRRGRRQRENLKLYLVPESHPSAETINANVWRAAEAVKAERVMDIISGKADIARSRGEMLLNDALNKWIEGHEAENSRKCNRTMANWLLRFAGDDVTLSQIDREFCAEFAEYLRIATGPRGKVLAATTARTFWQCFTACLSWAYRKGWMMENPCLRLELNERPHAVQAKKEYLTIEELRRFAATEPEDHYLRAYLFGCFCGLRWSDIKALRWCDIITSDGRTMARLTMQKTKSELFLPLSDSAVRWFPPRESTSDISPIFTLNDSGTANSRVRRAARAIGITKHLTFHTSRHTFATSLLTRGADLYVTSKLLGHASVRTTQIYANIVDERKRQTVDLLDGI